MKLAHWIDPRHRAVVCIAAWSDRRPRGVLLLGVRNAALVTCPDCRLRAHELLRPASALSRPLPAVPA